MVAVFTLVYKAKIVLTGFLMKIAIKRVLGRGGAKYALPWAAVPATAFWDAMVSHLCIVEAKLRGPTPLNLSLRLAAHLAAIR
jgi:hypothetical protein